MPAWAILTAGFGLFIGAPVVAILVEVVAPWVRAVRELRQQQQQQPSDLFAREWARVELLREQQATERAVRDLLRPRTGQVENVVPIDAAPSYNKAPGAAANGPRA